MTSTARAAYIRAASPHRSLASDRRHDMADLPCNMSVGIGMQVQLPEPPRSKSTFQSMTSAVAARAWF